MVTAACYCVHDVVQKERSDENEKPSVKEKRRGGAVAHNIFAGPKLIAHARVSVLAPLEPQRPLIDTTNLARIDCRPT